MGFSPTEAAFEGFRVVRRNPLAIVAWTLLYAAVSLTALFALSGSVDALVAWSERAEALEGATSPSPDQALAMFSEFGGIMLNMTWLIPLGLIVSAMLSAAVARAVLEPQSKGFGHLKLGMDEVRVAVVSLVLSIVFGVLTLVVFFAVAVIAGLAAAAGTGWGVLFAIIAGLGGTALIIWLLVRLSLAVPITVAEKRMAFFDSFAVTKGRFWPLLGMVVLVAVMTMLVWLLTSLVTMPVGIASGLQNSWSLSGGDDAELMRAALDVTNPWVIVSAVLEAIVNALIVAVIYAPFAAAYRGIKGTA